MTTKILALTDALGNLVRFVLLPGHRFDTVGVAPLIDGIAFGGLIADKAFDSNAIIANLNERGAKIVISQHPRRALPLRLDTELYKWRHLIENFFCKLKEFKRIRDAGRQNRSKLRSHHPPRRSRDKLTLYFSHRPVEHDPEKWTPVFRKDHAQTRC